MNRTPKAVLTAAALAMIAGVTHAEEAWFVTENMTLANLNTADPIVVNTGNFISGVQENETIIGLDFRPATGELFGLGSFDNLYTLDTATGAATLVGAGGFTPGLDGINFGFDFNPTIDRIRVVSNSDQNLVLNPNDGTSTGVTDLFYGPGDANEGTDPNVVSSAYTNSFAGATTSQLYGIDTGLDILVTQANSAGTLGTVGDLGIDISEVSGFDISGATGIAYLAARTEGGSISSLYTIDLATGTTTLTGEIAGGSVVTAFAVVPTPGAASVALLGCGALVTRRRRA